MIIEFFPEVSAIKCKSGFHELNNSAVSNDPVKTTLSTSLCPIKCSPTSSSRVGTKCNACFGTPDFHNWFTNSQPVKTVSGAGLKITVLPETSAAIIPPAGIAYGKFHGDATTTTPLGEDPLIFSNAVSPYNLANQ